MNIEQILRNYGIKYEKANEHFKVLCPFHDDHNPTGAISYDKGYFNCWVCKKPTNFYKYLAQVTKKSSRQIYFDLAKDGFIDQDNPLNPQDIERDHILLWGHQYFKDELYKRGITDDIIQLRRLGVYADRISIPITNMVGEYVNKRLYLPGGKTKEGLVQPKFLNLSGRLRSRVRLTPIEQLQYDKIMLCGGELKAYVAAKQLNEYDIGAVAPTCGEGKWDIKLTEHFKNKIVYICCDIDKAGIDAAERWARLLKLTVSELYIITLPLDIAVYPKGDINDFVYSGRQLISLIETSVKWHLSLKEEDDNEEPIDVTLDQAISASYAKRKVRLNVVVSSLDTSPYSIPKDVEIKCPRETKEEVCTLCPVYLTTQPDNQLLSIKETAIEIMEMVGQDTRKMQFTLKRAMGIPALCQVCTFNPKTFYHLEDAKVSEPIDLFNRDNNERNMQSAYFVGEERLQINEGYEIEGRMYPHPQNQQAALLINKYKLLQDALSSYKPESLDKLTIFQPDSWTLPALSAKLDHIYDDLSANASRIYKRQNMHIAVDLCYHSPLFVTWDGRKEKGWTEILIIGDSAMGKTQLINNMLSHYGLGDRKECKNATVAGLLGGLQQYGKRWFITWGVIPINDRRLCILEEIKGTPVEVISKLTDMRSSGAAEVVKIEKKRTNARTRLLVPTNPRSENPISAYGNGIEIIRELIGNPEDIRRFDAILIIDKREIDMDEVQRLKPTVDHVYTAALCRELILYCWTVENVRIEDEVFLLDKAKELGKKYTDEVPIVDRGSMHLKLARLSAALAGRTFSVENDDTLVVRNCHVEYVTRYLQECYDTNAFGYNVYSKRVLTANRMVNSDEIVTWISQHIAHPEGFVEAIALAEDFDIIFFQDLCDWRRDQAQTCISFLMRNRAIKKAGKVYRKTTDFTELLKNIKLEKLTVPKHLKDKF